MKSLGESIRDYKFWKKSKRLYIKKRFGLEINGLVKF